MSKPYEPPYQPGCFDCSGGKGGGLYCAACASKHSVHGALAWKHVCQPFTDMTSAGLEKILSNSPWELPEVNSLWTYASCSFGSHDQEDAMAIFAELILDERKLQTSLLAYRDDDGQPLDANHMQAIYEKLCLSRDFIRALIDDGRTSIELLQGAASERSLDYGGRVSTESEFHETIEGGDFRAPTSIGAVMDPNPASMERSSLERMNEALDLRRGSNGKLVCMICGNSNTMGLYCYACNPDCVDGSPTYSGSSAHPRPIESSNAERYAYGQFSQKYTDPFGGQQYYQSSSQRSASSGNSQTRASVAETEDYNRQIAPAELGGEGKIGIQRPGIVNAGGPDSIVYDPERDVIQSRDVKGRGPGIEFPCPRTPAQVLGKWGPEIDRAINGDPGDPLGGVRTGDDALDRKIRDAWAQRRFEHVQINVRLPERLPARRPGDPDFLADLK